MRPEKYQRPDNIPDLPSTAHEHFGDELAPDQFSALGASPQLIPAFDAPRGLTHQELRGRMTEACAAWLIRSPSANTRTNYSRDLEQFFAFLRLNPSEPDSLTTVRPHHVAAWRDHLRAHGLSNSSIRRKMTALRSLFSYLKTYGYLGANPAHSDFVEAPAVPRDGKTVGITPKDCRRLLDAPDVSMPAGVRDRAILAILAFSACRVGELAKLRVGDYKATGGYKVIEVMGKGGKERRIPLHPEAIARIEEWLDAGNLRDEKTGPLFRATVTARGGGHDGFRETPLTCRGVQFLIKRYARQLGLDPAITVHSFRVTALTTARENGVDIIDLQDFAGHADPRTTLSYIRSRDRLSKSPAYVLRY
jgi:integrase/recombinase XerD